MFSGLVAAVVQNPALAALAAWAVLAAGVASDDDEGNTLDRAAAMPWVLRAGAVLVGLFVVVRTGVMG